MAITVNGTVIVDGAPLTINGVQATRVTVNGVEVWVNTVATTTTPKENK